MPSEAFVQEAQDSIFEDSCLILDPMKSKRTRNGVCGICMLNEDLLMNKGPLFPLGTDDTESYFMCNNCLKQFVTRNMKVSRSGSGSVIRYEIDNLVTPAKQIEFPRNFVVEGKTVDLVTVPKIGTNVYLMLERTNYERRKGHIEGLVLKFNQTNELKLGSDEEMDVVFPSSMEVLPHHLTIKFDKSSYSVFDNSKPCQTLIKPYNNPVLDSENPHVLLKMHDYLIKFTWKNNVSPTSSEFLLLETGFQEPAYKRRENLMADSEIQESSSSNILGIEKNEARLFDHKGKVNKVPKFPVYFGSIEKHQVPQRKYPENSNSNGEIPLSTDIK